MQTEALAFKVQDYYSTWKAWNGLFLQVSIQSPWKPFMAQRKALGVVDISVFMSNTKCCFSLTAPKE